MPQPQHKQPESLAQEADELTRQFVGRFYRHDSDWCLSWCTPTVTYLGTTSGGYALNAEHLREVMAHLRRQYNPSLVVSLDTLVRPLPVASAILVLARFHLVSNPPTGTVRATHRVATLIWLSTPAGLRLQHLQVATPLTAQDTADDLARLTRETYRYAKGALDQIVRGSSVVLRDVDGTTHHVSAIEVRVVEAMRQRCIVHCDDRDIVVRQSFAHTVDAFGETLVRVHRSFAINPRHLRLMGSDAVIMDDGTRVPLPARRSREIRRTLEHVLRSQPSPPYLGEPPMEKG